MKPAIKVQNWGGHWSRNLYQMRALAALVLRRSERITSIPPVWKKNSTPLLEILCSGSFIGSSTISQKIYFSIHLHILMKNTFVGNFPTSCWCCQQCFCFPWKFSGVLFLNTPCWNYPIYTTLTPPFHLWTSSHVEKSLLHPVAMPFFGKNLLTLKPRQSEFLE